MPGFAQFDFVFLHPTNNFSADGVCITQVGSDKGTARPVRGYAKLENDNISAK